MASVAQSIASEIFLEDANTYAVLDGASVPGLLEKLDQWKPEFVCLYRGELKDDLAAVAPYLVRLEPETEMTEWILSKGWGNHWGIFAIADADLNAMRQHNDTEKPHDPAYGVVSGRRRPYVQYGLLP